MDPSNLITAITTAVVAIMGAYGGLLKVKHQVEDHETRLQSLEDDNERLREREQELLVEIDKLRKQLKRRDSRIQELEAELEQVRARLAALDGDGDARADGQ